MKRSAILAALVAVTTLFTALTANRAASEKKTLMLSVTLGTPLNPHFEVNMPVEVNQPFKIVTTNGVVTNTISGTISAPVQGKYPLPLFVSEWADKDDNISGTTDLNLELDKAFSGGPVQSFVYMRTVELTQVPE